MKPIRKRMMALDRLEETFCNCTRCGLSEHRNKVIHWRGSPSARLCAVGEAPGQKEDEKGVPFVGSAGRKFDELLTKAGLDPSQDIFIINLIGCRPPGNRVPTLEEWQACRVRFQMLLAICRPKVLLLLGGTAAKRLAGIGSITRWRGRKTEVEIIDSQGRVKTYPTVPTFHPSYLNRLGNDPITRGKMIYDIKLAWAIANGECVDE